MSGAPGLDGWRVDELKVLPRVLLDHLAELLNLIEDTGVWPQALQQCAVSLIPKTGGSGPLDLRPISIMSSLYRLWAARRLQDLKSWQEAWATKGQHAYRSGHRVDDIFWKLAVQIEDATLHGTPFFGISFDYVKCFDLIPHELLLEMVDEMGLHPCVAKPLRSMYCGLKRRFRAGGGIGLEFASTNGILQGCPISVILVNALMGIWAKAVEAEIP
eukprot:5586703-Karenia_brevis.AAC.1